MDKASSVTTGGLVVSAASLVPAVEWLLSGMPKPVPDTVSYLAAGLIAAGVHAGYNYILARTAAKAAEAKPATPAQ